MANKMWRITRRTWREIDKYESAQDYYTDGRARANLVSCEEGKGRLVV